MLKPKCLDVILFFSLTYATQEILKNKEIYKQIDYPFYDYIIVSILILVVFRCTHFLGQFLQGDVDNVDD